MTTAVTQISMVVTRRYGMSVMIVRSQVINSSGTSAKGMPKDSMIWEKTSAWVLLTGRARMISEGSMVSAQRAGRGICRLTKPPISLKRPDELAMLRSASEKVVDAMHATMTGMPAGTTTRELHKRLPPNRLLRDSRSSSAP
jgi:Xaa-Pro aminopeptidase